MRWRRGRGRWAVAPDAALALPAAPAADQPDDVVAQRLRARMAARTGDYQAQLAAELTVIETLVDLGRVDEAAAALDEQAAALGGLAAALESALVDAAVEREAEQIVASVAADLGVGAAATNGPRQDRTAVPARRPARLAGAVAAVAVVIAALVPAFTTPEPPLTLADAEARVAELQLSAARARLDALTSGNVDAEGALAAEVRQLHAAIRSLPADVLAEPTTREEVRGMLLREHAALRSLFAHLPDAALLLGELRALGLDLALDLGLDDLGPTLAVPSPVLVFPVFPPTPVLPLPITPALPPVDDAAPDPAPAPEPAPAPAPAPAPEPDQDTEAGSDPAPDPGPDPGPDPDPDLAPEPEPAPGADAAPDAEPEPDSEPTATPSEGPGTGPLPLGGMTAGPGRDVPGADLP